MEHKIQYFENLKTKYQNNPVKNAKCSGHCVRQQLQSTVCSARTVLR